MNSTIVVSDRDAAVIRDLLNPRNRFANADREDCKKLQAELERAQIIPDSDFPSDAVRLGSSVSLENLTSGETMNFTLVLPHEADPGEGLLSILAPLGTGLLGFRIGDEVEWPVPSGTIRVRIRDITESTTEDD